MRAENRRLHPPKIGGAGFFKSRGIVKQATVCEEPDVTPDRAGGAGARPKEHAGIDLEAVVLPAMFGVRGTIRSAGGSPEDPARSVKAETGLSREIPGPGGGRPRGFPA